jgi:putative tryptophan/tyrosine transport system substrate-binding protein
MKRREFIAGLGGAAAAWPLAARAQQDGLPRLVYLSGAAGDDSDTQTRLAAFRTPFGKLGWVDDRNVRIDYRMASTAGRERAIATEVVHSAPAVIFSSGTPMSNALQLETATIPVVFAAASDPQASGLVNNMARPGGNLTGFTNYLFSFGSKWLQMLKEAAPATKRVLVILAPGNRAQQGFLRAIETAAATLGVQPVAAIVRDAAEVKGAIEAFAREPNGSLLVLPGAPGTANSELIIDLAAQHRLPAIYTHRFFMERGGLMSYDTEISDLYRRAAFYVDRILKGAKPSDLPVQLPTKYDLVVNLKVAKTLGLTISLALLATADEVIE